jgi:hypothetical protein
MRSLWRRYPEYPGYYWVTQAFKGSFRKPFIVQVFRGSSGNLTSLTHGKVIHTGTGLKAGLEEVGSDLFWKRVPDESLEDLDTKMIPED